MRLLVAGVRELGAAEFLPKPMDENALMSAVARSLATPSPA
jgi:FixJ family two-component response regulator